jgi:hypothetical protein
MQLLDTLFQKVPAGEVIEVKARKRSTDPHILARSEHFGLVTAKRWATEYANNGYDVYFGIATRTAGSLGDRTSIRTIPAIWADCDHKSPAMLLSYLLPPSFIIDSGHGYHAYWLLARPLHNPTLVERLNKGVQKLAHADAAGYPATQVLRVPGTYNYKDGAGATDRRLSVTQLYGNSALAYTSRDLEWALAIPEDIRRLITVQSPRGTRSDRDWHLINRLVEAGLTDRAIEGIYIAHACGDKAREFPGYLPRTIFQVRKAYAMQQDGLTAPPNPPVKDAPSDPAVVEHSLSPRAADEVVGVGVGAPLVTGLSGDLVKGVDGYYSVSKGGNAARVSSFVFDVLALQQGKGSDAYVVNISCGNHTWRNKLLPGHIFTSAAGFCDFLPYMQMTWLGGDMTTRKLRALLAQEWAEVGQPYMYTTTTLGRNLIDDAHDVYVTNAGAYNRDLTQVSDVVYVSLGQEAPELEIIPPIHGRALGDAFRSVRSVNRVNVVAPLLGWFLACHLKPLLEKNQVRFPHLMIYGSRGAGKTSLITRVFQPLHGYTAPTSWQANSTPFVLLTLLGSTTSIPLCLTEFRESTQKNQGRFLQLLRTAYDFGRDARGHSDQTTTSYYLTAPICVDGEEPVSDPAMIERTIMVYLDVRDVNTFTQGFQDVLTHNLKGAGSTILQRALSLTIEDVLALYQRSLSLIEQVFPKGGSSRVRSNQAVTLMGLIMLEECLIAAGETTPFPTSPPHVLTYFTETEDLTVDGTRTRLGVDDFLEDVINHIFASRTNGRPPDVNYRFQPDRDGKVVGIHFKSAYSWWRKQQSSMRQDPPSIQALRKQLGELEGNIVKDAHNAQTQFGRIMRLYFIDLGAAVTAGLDVDILE